LYADAASAAQAAQPWQVYDHMCALRNCLSSARHSSRPRVASKRHIGEGADVDVSDGDGASAHISKTPRSRRPPLTFEELYIGLRVDAKWIILGGTMKKHAATVIRLHPTGTAGADSGTADIEYATALNRFECCITAVFIVFKP
jgi:hypothetical protein